jgi:hypothetical protein
MASSLDHLRHGPRIVGPWCTHSAPFVLTFNEPSEHRLPQHIYQRPTRRVPAAGCGGKQSTRSVKHKAPAKWPGLLVFTIKFHSRNQECLDLIMYDRPHCRYECWAFCFRNQILASCGFVCEGLTPRHLHSARSNCPRTRVTAARPQVLRAPWSVAVMLDTVIPRPATVQAMAQSSILSPGTRVNSPVFAVTSKALRRRAWAAIRTS